METQHIRVTEIALETVAEKYIDAGDTRTWVQRGSVTGLAKRRRDSKTPHTFADGRLITPGRWAGVRSVTIIEATADPETSAATFGHITTAQIAEILQG